MRRSAQLPEETRKALVAAFDAMAAWRNDMVAANEKAGGAALDRMSQAATALGWPAQIIDSTREQMQGVTRMQAQMIDKMMDAWEEQIKSPNPMADFPTAMMNKLKSMPGMQGMPGMPGMPGMGAMPGFPGMPQMPGMEAFSGMMTNPMQFWMQMGEQWQKNWARAMQTWASNAGANQPGGKRSW